MLAHVDIANGERMQMKCSNRIRVGVVLTSTRLAQLKMIFGQHN